MAKYSTFHYGDGTDYGATANGLGEVTWIFQVDWNGDGSLDGSNEGAYMVDLQFDRGERHYVSRSGEFETPQEGRLSAVMDNSTKRYDPYNASGPLYGNLKPGRICQLRVMINATSVEYVIFTGQILDIRPESGTDKVRIEVVDGWGRLKGAKIAMANAYISQPMHQCIIYMLMWSEVPNTPAWNISVDMQPVRVFYVKDEDAGRVLPNLAQSALGYFFFDRYNRPTFYPRNYNSMTTHTIDQSQVHKEIMISQPWDLISNHITVIAHRIVMERSTSIWSLADPLYIAAGDSKTIVAVYDPSVLAGMTYQAFANINGTGRELTRNFAITYPNGMFGTSRVTFMITNNSGTNGYLTELIIYGRRLADRPLEYVAEDTASQAEYGVRFFMHDKPYLQSRNYAESFASTIEAFLDDVNREIIIRIEQRPTIQYAFELHDKVAFTSSTLGINGTYYIIGLHHDWAVETGQKVYTTVYLSPIIYDTTVITPEPIDEETPIPSVPPSEPPEEPPGGGGVPPGGGVTPLPGQAVAVAAGSGIFVTPNFGEASPTWTSKGFTAAGLLDFDVSIDENYALAITDSKIYRCTDLLSVGSSTWAEVYDASTLGTSGSLFRVHWSPTTAQTAFVLAACQGADTATADAYMLKSTDGGVTWAANLIKEGAGTSTAYTVTQASATLNHPVAGVNDYAEPEHERVGDEDNTVNPWATAIQAGVMYNIGLDPQAYTIDSTIHSATDLTMLRAGVNNLLSSGNQAVAAGWLTDYFGSYTPFPGTPQYPLDANRTKVRFETNWGANTFSTTVTSWVFWNAPDVSIPAVFDVAPDGGWLYVGFDDSIYKSEDGGTTWVEWINTDGANDIHVDPQLSGIPYFLSDDGLMRYLNVRTPVTIAGLTETPLEIPLRIARCINGGELWVAANGNINRRLLGAWSVQDTYAGEGRSLRAYTGGTRQRLVYLDGNTVQYSEDAGATWSAKTGNLSISSAKTIHLLE